LPLAVVVVENATPGLARLWAEDGKAFKAEAKECVPVEARECVPVEARECVPAEALADWAEV
jgi:hypothetical protein